MRILLTLFCALILLASCNSNQEKVKVIGDKIVLTKNINGTFNYDTISAQSPRFCLMAHDSAVFCSEQLKGKVFVVDFFFTHCPSICVAMKKNMILIHDKFAGNSALELVSVSIDPARDSVRVLYDYARKLGVENTNWHFLTGSKDSIYALADKFLALASEDSNSPGGFIHDGNFILVDKSRKIRGFYDGTNSESVMLLMKDIETLTTD